MNTPDKCPQCGAIRVEGREYACGFIFREGVKHNPRTHECLLNSERTAHAATKLELELFQKYAAQKTCKESQSITADRKIAELEHDLFALKSKADRCETEMNQQAARANAAESRVRELEGLEITRAEHFAQGTIVSFHLARVVDLKSKTLGEAMPRKDDV